jgi:hypothetical protein
MALIAILATAASTSAQSGYGIRISVPFDFAVGDKTYSPGGYTVAVTSNLNLLELRSRDGRKTAFVTSTIPIRPAGDQYKAQLEFHRYGDRYFLYKVWLGAEGHQLPKSKLERDLIEDRSEGAGHAETVIVTG